MALRGRIVGMAKDAGGRRLLPMAVVLIGLAIPMLWIVTTRLQDSSDRTMHYFAPGPSRTGISVARVSGGGGLRAGDEVVAIDGRSLEGWLQAGPTRRPQKGEEHVYRVLREGRTESGYITVDLPVRLTSYPLPAVLQVAGSAALLLAAFFAVSVIAFVRRPSDLAARTLFAIPVLISVGATSWPFGPQIVDLITPGGHWSYIGGGIANALAWGAFLHLALILPRPPVVLQRRPWLIGVVYVLPFLLYAAYVLMRVPGANDLDRLRVTSHVSLPAARTYPLLIFAAVLAGLLRERKREPSRQLWPEFALCAACPVVYVLLGQLPQAFGRPPLPPAWLALVLLPLPLAVGSAILRHRLFDVDLVVRRSVVYGVVSASLLMLYLPVAYLLTSILDPRVAALIATALAALTAHPLWITVRRTVGRRFFGQRHEPLAVANTLSEIDMVGAPDAVLGQVAATLAKVLRLAYAAVEVGPGPGQVAFRATYGEPQGEPQAIPLTFAGQRLGTLSLSVATGLEAFGAADRRLITELARQLGITGYTLLLAADLQRSREQLVGAREEERRRLRRDLHDGLGPTLAANAMQLEITRNLLRVAPEEAEEFINRLLEGTRRAIADVRRLVDNLRPPALDQLGLVAAIRERATYFARPEAEHLTPLTVTVDGAGDLNTLPAAVEVAAFHIAMEAVTNAARHAGARTCRVRLEAGGHTLTVEVADDGVGLGPTRREGVGLSSMRQRATEVGGTCTIETNPGRGTVVRATLPLFHPSPVSGDVPPAAPGTGQRPHDDGTPPAGNS